MHACLCVVHVQDGATPIIIAALQGHKACIETLASLGGDVNQANEVSIFMWWWSMGSAVVQYTVVHACLCVVYVQHEKTPMYAAAEMGHKECIETLASLGGDVNQANVVSILMW